jgi:hypothetical protein
MANLTQCPTSISTSPRSGPPPGRRLVALILSVALVLASTFPGFALAGEADSEGEGSTPPIEVPVGPPDFDPGGEEDGLEEEVPAVDEEGTAVEPEAEVEIEVPAAEEVTSTSAGEVPVEAAPPPPNAEPEPEESAPVQHEASEPSEPVANAEIIAPPQPQPAAGSGAPGSAASDAVPPAEPIQQGEASAPSSHGGDASSPPDSPDRDLAGADRYVVRRGDCLWHIAAAALPAGSDTQAIADKVAELWRLNEDRIGTGDPNLIYPGTVLRLH